MHNQSYSQLRSFASLSASAAQYSNKFEQCQMVVFVADVLGFWGPWIPDLVTELCPPKKTLLRCLDK